MTLRGFFEELEEVMKSVPQTEKVFLGGNLNGQIGTQADGYDMMHGCFGYGERTSEGVTILNFAIAFDLTIVNTFFKKED